MDTRNADIIFPETFEELKKILPLLKKEAEKKRWRNIEPGNFILIIKEDLVEIVLKNTDGKNYEIKFWLGLFKNCFGSYTPDETIGMGYEYKIISEDKDVKSYYSEEIKSFSNTARTILEIIFSWKAIFIHCEDGFEISINKTDAVQKFCLMLDMMIPLKDEYEPSEILITEEMYETIKEMEEKLGTELDIVEEHLSPEERVFLFSKGYFE